MSQLAHRTCRPVRNAPDERERPLTGDADEFWSAAFNQQLDERATHNCVTQL